MVGQVVHQGVEVVKETQVVGSEGFLEGLGRLSLAKAAFQVSWGREVVRVTLGAQ